MKVEITGSSSPITNHSFGFLPIRFAIREVIIGMLNKNNIPILKKITAPIIGYKGKYIKPGRLIRFNTNLGVPLRVGLSASIFFVPRLLQRKQKRIFAAIPHAGLPEILLFSSPFLPVKKN